MIAELGLVLLWLSTACAALQGVAGLVPAARLRALAVPAAITQGWLWIWVAGALGWVFWTTDLSVAGVAATTAADLPPPLRLVATVVQDGGWLVVATLLAAWGGALLAFVAGHAKRAVGAAGLAALLLSLLLLMVDPFSRLVPAPTAGASFPASVRATLAAIGPPGSSVLDAQVRLGETRNRVTLSAVTPVAGPDSTGVLGEVRVGGTTLTPEWRETTAPRAAFAVTATALGSGGWYAATLAPAGPGAAPGQWRVAVTCLAWWWPGLALVALAAAAWRWRRNR